ncbi:hypothetical protein [Extensimonas vulgaris]|uniref:hypothetical protein n=1 Tax=Extensimonas vulgaris TaxID=1031594 RepID=UPI001474B9DB|nr:hypothetical protein [Extensimonas vulgaris]
MGQEDGKKWAAAAHSQPTTPKSDRLLECSVRRYLRHKTASFRPGPRCKSSRYRPVSLWFAPYPDQKSIGFICRIKHQTLH